jgi:hypothetical protein
MMESETLFSNKIGLPQELVPHLVDSWVCEYASIKKNGTPVTLPLVPWPGEYGSTIDVNTGLGYPTKAEWSRNNPHVCVSYSDPTAMTGDNPPIILVYGHATVYDSDLQGNTDRYLQGLMKRSKMFGRMPMFVLRRMAGYLTRIWISVTPLKVLWWPEGDLEKTPQSWYAPHGTQAPPSDPRPEPLSQPHKPLVKVPKDWRSAITEAFDILGKPILTVVDEEGYPVPFRANGGSLESDGVHLELPSSFPTKAQGRACMTFHTINISSGDMASNNSMVFSGVVSRDGDSALFQVKRRLPDANFRGGISGLISTFQLTSKAGKRLDIEAARRGQPVPVIRRIK